jgi:hypothetical protein
MHGTSHLIAATMLAWVFYVWEEYKENVKYFCLLLYTIVSFSAYIYVIGSIISNK